MKTINFKALFLTLVTLVMSVTTQVWATDVTTPENLPGYYENLEGKSGKALFDAINAVCQTGYIGLTYAEVWEAYEKTDVKSDGTSIWDIYSYCSNYTYYNSQEGKSGANSNEGDCYNREHSIPKNWFGQSSGPIANSPGTDLFHLLATDKIVNSTRSSYAYGEVTAANTTSASTKGCGGFAEDDLKGYCRYGTASSITISNTIVNSSGATTETPSVKVFEPLAEFKGDLARGYFGTILKWESNSTYNDFTKGAGSAMFQSSYDSAHYYGLTAYSVALLMKWHREDPVSEKEIARNNGIQETQGNRNPFIDYPELAEYLWGNEATSKKKFARASAVATFKDEYDPKTGTMTGGGGSTCTKLATPAVTAVASNQTITLTWESVTGASSYVVSVGLGLYTTECTEATIGTVSTSGTTNTCVITGLTNDVEYTTTVYAVASDDQCNSDADVDTATPFVLEGLSALKTAGAGSHEVILANALVTYVKDNSIAYIQDASTGLLIYNVSNLGLSAGDVINGLVAVTTKQYNGLWEATAFDYSNATRTTGATVTPAAVTIADLLDANNYSTYESVLVKITGATVKTVSGKNITITQNDNDIVLRDQNGTSTITATEGATVNVTGWLADYNSTKQLHIWYQDQIEEVNTISYVVTWSVNGAETSDDAVAAGTALTLPANPAACANGKVFVGWTDAADFTGTDDQIAAIFTEAGNKTIDADITYYAVFATATTTEASEVTTYEKVTTEPADWSGTYLIVNDAANKLFNGLSGVDKVDDVTISDGVIAYSESVEKNEVLIATMDGGYSLQMNANATNNAGKYLYGHASKNQMNFGTTAQLNTIDFEDGDVTITNVLSDGSTILKYNNATQNGNLFRYYYSSTNTAPLVQLYKKTITSTPASTSYSEYSLLCGDVIPCTLSEITLNTTGVKTEFLTGETFTADGLVVSAAHTGSNCTDGEVTGWTASEPNMTAAGTQTITISYTEEGVTKTATYDIEVVAPLANLLALKDAGAGTYYVDLDDAISTYYGTVNDKNIAFIQDATSGLYVYGVATEEIFKKGNIINGVVKVTTTDYNGLIEATAFDKFSAIVTEGGTVTEKAVTIAELISGEYNEYESVLVKISGAIVKSAFASRNATITQNNNDLVLRNQNSAGTITATVDDVVNVTGWLSRYTKNNVSTLQLQIFEQSQIEEVPEVTYTITVTQPTGATIAADAESAVEGATVTLSYDNLADAYQFDGWVVKTEGGDAVAVTNNQFTMPAENVTVTATVSIRTFVLTFNIGTESYTTDPLPYGTPFSTIIAAAMVKYNFEVVNDKYVLAKTDSIYTLEGWAEVAELPTTVIAAGTYTAVFSAVAQQYKITWSIDGVETSEMIDYGQTPTHADPTKDATATTVYEFTGWTPAIVPVAGNATYTAEFAESEREYTITWRYADEYGNPLVDEETYYYNDKLKDLDRGYGYQDDTYTYTFEGWLKNGVGTDTIKYNSTIYVEDSYEMVAVFSKERWIGISFYDEDGTTLLQFVQCTENVYPAFTEPTPRKDGKIFAGWTPKVTIATETKSYRATYTDVDDNEALTGSFSVSSSKRVQFSRGNLQYNAADNTWALARAQYDIVGMPNLYLGYPDYKGLIDMFSLSTNDRNDYGINPSNKDADYVGDFVDWGSLIGTDWYTMSNDEWTYLLSKRPNAKQLWANAMVVDRKGLVILPDDWQLPAGAEFTPRYKVTNYEVDDFESNKYNLEQWKVMEAAGAVFLPAAGIRTGGYQNMWKGDAESTFVNEETGYYNWMSNVDIYGRYWTSTVKSTRDAYFLILGGIEEYYNYEDPVKWACQKRYGQSVRLAREAQYTVTAEADAHGSVTGSGVYTYGSSASLVATPDEHYQFTGWSDGVADATRQLVVTCDTTVTALFALDQFTISASGENGTVEGTGTYDYGTEIQLTANGNPGYTFDKWSDNVTQNPRTVIVTEDATFTAIFKNVPYTITKNVEGQGSITGPDGGSLNEVVTLTAVPAEGWAFAHWENDSEDPSRDLNITGDMVVKATFTVNSYTLKYMVDGEQYGDAEVVEYGKAVTAKDAPEKEGYTFSGWSDIPATMPAHDVTITGTFGINTYNVIYKVDGDVYKTVPYEFGAAITAEAAPVQTGYNFSGWSDIPATMPARDVTVTGSFTIQTFVLTFVIGNESFDTDPLPYNTKMNDVIAAAMPVYGFTIENGKYILAKTDSIYTLTGWAEVAELPAFVTETATYTALFSAVAQQYKITWSIDGVETSEMLDYGQTPTHAEPTKEATATQIFTFKAWSPTIQPVTGDATYMAIFESGVRLYTITFVVGTQTIPVPGIEYGTALSTVVAGALAQTDYELIDGKYQYDDGTNIYTFTGFVDADSQSVEWETATVTGDATYTMTYTTEPKIPTGWENVEQDRPAVKVVENGMLYIIRDGKKYSAQGRLME